MNVNSKKGFLSFEKFISEKNWVATFFLCLKIYDGQTLGLFSTEEKGTEGARPERSLT